MACEAPPRVAQGIQASGVGTVPENGVESTGAGDPTGDAARLKHDHLRPFCF